MTSSGILNPSVSELNSQTVNSVNTVINNNNNELTKIIKSTPNSKSSAWIDNTKVTVIPFNKVTTADVSLFTNALFVDQSSVLKFKNDAGDELIVTTSSGLAPEVSALPNASTIPTGFTKIVFLKAATPTSPSGLHFYNTSTNKWEKITSTPV